MEMFEMAFQLNVSCGRSRSENSLTDMFWNCFSQQRLSNEILIVEGPNRNTWNKSDSTIFLEVEK